MCGLVAIINKLNNGFTVQGKDNFTNMLYADAIRGMDSTGVFLVNNIGNVLWGKSKYNPVHLFVEKEWDNILDEAYKRGTFLVGHNRKATMGRITDNTAHPFIEKDIILVHNGTLTNHKEIGNTEVDSHAICKSIANKGHLETIKELQGAFALIWYDINKKSLFVCRNDKRPLSFTETVDSYYLSSEAGLSKWIIQRNQWGSKILQETEIKVGVLYEFPVDKPEDYTETNLELHKTIFATPNYNIYEKKNLPVVTTNTTTNKTNHKYKLGQYVPFYIEDYQQFLDNVTIAKILGVTEDEHKTQVEINYNEQLLIYLTEAQNIIGKIKQIAYNPTTKIQTLILQEDSITSGFITESKNKLEITSTDWNSQKKHCSKCNDEVTFSEIPDTIIYKKNKTYIPICEQCIINAKSIGKLKNVLSKNNLVRV